MKNFSGFLVLLLSAALLSCGTPPAKVEVPKPKIDNAARLENFFQRSEKDSVRAGSVIEKQRIIQHLTHLRKMDRGGKKFYLLEKDDITAMIRAVTEGVYLDYILINRHGDVVYTKKNDEIFGVNVNEGFEATPLKRCFISRKGVYFEDVSFITPASKVYSLYISNPVYVEGEYHGTLILQVEPGKISEILETGTEIFSRDGIFRVSYRADRIFSKYPVFEKIDFPGLDSGGVLTMAQPEGDIRLTRFRFREIDWVISSRL